MTYFCYKTIQDTNQVVKSRLQGSLADCLSPSPLKERRTLIRARADTGSGSREPGSGKGAGKPEKLASSSQTNSKPFVKSGGFFVMEGVRWLLPGIIPLHGAVPGPG